VLKNKIMFSYYGSKSKLVNLYPIPIYNRIVEPFAGSARYALKYFDRDVIIVEKFHKVFAVWEYLQNASENDILSLPNIGYKEKIPVSLSNAERWLIGYCVSRGVPRPSTMGHKFNSWQRDKVRISGSLYKIRHWDIRLGDYSDLDNYKATWYIDPPYQTSGYKYSYNKINYKLLATWCKCREGQVIVCENGDADWLPFSPLKKFTGAFRYKDNKNSRMEVVWYNIPLQPSLF
jgi:site-specific DNA-adenine methylase